MSREALLAAVAADPDADLPRLVFADWLDDHGDADRAEFIRFQCATAAARPTDPDWLPRKLREYELFDRHRPEWMPVGDDEIAHMLACRWRRGFPDWVPIDTPAAGLNGRYHVGAGGDDDDRHLMEAAGRPGVAVVRGLSVSSFRPHLEPGLRAEWCRTVREVSLMAWYGSCVVPVVDTFCRFLAALPADHWPGLRQLSLDGHPSDDGLRALTDAPATGGLTALGLWLGRGPSQGVRAAALGRFVRRVSPHLEELDLSNVTAEQAAAVAAVRWPKLRRLTLRWAYPVAVTRLLAADLPALTELLVHLMPPHDSHHPSARELRRLAAALAAAPLVVRLGSLTLNGWPVDSLTDFWPTYRGKPLDRFGLRMTDDSADAPRLADLSRIPAFRDLKTLDLFSAWGGLSAVADPAVFPELHSVRVADRATPQPTTPLRWRGGERRLVIQQEGFNPRPDAYAWTAD